MKLNSSSFWLAVPLLSIVSAAVFHGGCSGCNGKDEEDSGGAGGNPLDGGSGGAASLVFVDENPLEEKDGVYQTDPDTCAKAAEVNSYVGCDFWPTVTSNGVWSTYKFAVVVANGGATEAQVVVQRGTGESKNVVVAPNQLKKIYLDWVPQLKGEDNDSCNLLSPLAVSVQAPTGAYHLTSTVPVSVYQFNPLLYQKPTAGTEDAGGFDATMTCPGDLMCANASVVKNPPQKLGCFSFSNDASLLLPSTALTGNYRITGHEATTGASTYVTVTGTADGTTVKMQLPATAGLQAGGTIAATPPGKVVEFTLNAGDVAQLVASPPAEGANADLSGAVVNATKPVQIIAGMPCVVMPTNLQTEPTCDHIEESILPAETLGKRYFITAPTGPKGTSAVGHIVKVYGNRDATQLLLAYADGTTEERTINAGEVIEIKAPEKDYLEQDFQIISTNNQEFAVASFMLSGSVVDTDRIPHRGDPAATQFAAVAQYRKKYVFLAPDNYPNSYVDIVHPVDAKMQLDGIDIMGTPQVIPLVKTQTKQYGVTRLPLNSATGGSHLLTSDQPVGLQVIGYGSYTSYQYAGGLNLGKIAEPPTILRLRGTTSP